jgi:hypothetical protein
VEFFYGLWANSVFQFINLFMVVNQAIQWNLRVRKYLFFRKTLINENNFRRFRNLIKVFIHQGFSKKKVFPHPQIPLNWQNYYHE